MTTIFAAFVLLYLEMGFSPLSGGRTLVNFSTGEAVTVQQNPALDSRPDAPRRP